MIVACSSAAPPPKKKKEKHYGEWPSAAIAIMKAKRAGLQFSRSFSLPSANKSLMEYVLQTKWMTYHENCTPAGVAHGPTDLKMASDTITACSHLLRFISIASHSHLTLIPSVFWFDANAHKFNWSNRCRPSSQHRETIDSILESKVKGTKRAIV